MTDIGIFIFGMFVFGVAIGSSLIAMIGASDPALNPSENKKGLTNALAASPRQSQPADGKSLLRQS